MSDVEDMLKAFEGTGPVRNGVYYPYPDSEGITTIGIGHNLEAKGVAADIAQRWFMEDIADALDAVRHNFSCYDQLSRPRQLVLISMGFQFGHHKLGKWIRFISAVHLGRWDDAADELMDSDAGRKLPTRFKKLAKMMREDVSEWV